MFRANVADSTHFTTNVLFNTAKSHLVEEQFHPGMAYVMDLCKTKIFEKAKHIVRIDEWENVSATHAPNHFPASSLAPSHSNCTPSSAPTPVYTPISALNSYYAPSPVPSPASTLSYNPFSISAGSAQFRRYRNPGASY